MKGNNMNTWNIIGSGINHIKDMKDQSAKGKAICGVRFTYWSAIAGAGEVEEGTLVNCARCLVKVGWAKKVRSYKLENSQSGMQREVGYSTTYYELVKELKNSALTISRAGIRTGRTDHTVGTEFLTNTENRQWK
jgi:hypothetical protein